MLPAPNVDVPVVAVSIAEEEWDAIRGIWNTTEDGIDDGVLDAEPFDQALFYDSDSDAPEQVRLGSIN